MAMVVNAGLLTNCLNANVRFRLIFDTCPPSTKIRKHPDGHSAHREPSCFEQVSPGKEFLKCSGVKAGVRERTTEWADIWLGRGQECRARSLRCEREPCGGG